MKAAAEEEGGSPPEEEAAAERGGGDSGRGKGHTSEIHFARGAFRRKKKRNWRRSRSPFIKKALLALTGGSSLRRQEGREVRG
jgi:hypothetical protein